MDIKEIRELTGLNQTDFANRIHFDRYRQLLEAIKTPYFSMVCGDSSNC